MGSVSEHPAQESTPDDAVASEAAPDRSGSAAARGAWMSTGITFFSVGVVFTLTMPDNIALGITFLGLGVVFFSLAGSRRAPGNGAASPPASPAAAPSPGSPPEPPRG